MAKPFYLIFVCSAVFVAGCYHGRIVSAADAKDYGESIRTKYRYRLICENKGDWASKRQELQMYQPGVFDDSGMPITFTVSSTLHDTDVNATVLLAFFSFGIFPYAGTDHLHRSCTLTAAGRRIASFGVCVRKGKSVAIHPLPVLFFSWPGSTCFPSAKEFTEHDYDQNSPPYLDLVERAVAYGIAAHLKEAEDSGRMDERFSSEVRSSQSLADAAAMRAKIAADDKARRGMGVTPRALGGSAQPFEIVKCDNEKGKDFAYTFTLRRRGGGAATLSDYGVIRSAFRSAIRTHYASSHPDVNPRTLIIDFTDYALREGVVVGRVAVLSVTPESLSYDSTSRKGMIRIRIGEGQFEDARRWIRRNLAALASRSNIQLTGNAVPQGGRFFSEREEMRDGLLEVSFRTE